MNFKTRILMLAVFSIALVAPVAEAQDGAATQYPEIDKFAAAIEGTIWDLRGTSSLKHLRYDGESVCSLNSRDEPGAPYDSAFVDVGVIRLNFRGPRTAWYFFSDDLKWVTPVTAQTEMVFGLSEGAEPKAVKTFPQDIEGVVWEIQPDERDLPELNLRWNGSQLESAVKNDGEWVVEKLTTAQAAPRVLEAEMADGLTVWYAFSEDGREAWLLVLEKIFGGHAREVTRGDESATIPEGMGTADADIFRHALQLKAAGEAGRVATLRRYLLRNYADKREVAMVVERVLRTQ